MRNRVEAQKSRELKALAAAEKEQLKQQLSHLERENERLRAELEHKNAELEALKAQIADEVPKQGRQMSWLDPLQPPPSLLPSPLTPPLPHHIP